MLSTPLFLFAHATTFTTGVCSNRIQDGPDAWALFVREAHIGALSRRPDLDKFWTRSKDAAERFDGDRESAILRTSQEAWSGGRFEDTLRILFTGVVDMGTSLTPLFDEYTFRLAQLGRWSEAREVIAANSSSYQDGTSRTQFLALAMVESNALNPGLANYLQLSLRTGNETPNPLFDRLYPRKGGVKVSRVLAWIEFLGGSHELAYDCEAWAVNRSLELFPADPLLVNICVDKLTSQMEQRKIMSGQIVATRAKQVRSLCGAMRTLQPAEWIYKRLWDQLVEISPSDAKKFARPVKQQSKPSATSGTNGLIK